MLHVGVVLDDAACRRAFSGYSRLPALAFERRSILGSHFMSFLGMTGTYGSQLESPHKVLVEAKVALEEDQADKVVSEVDKAVLEVDEVALEEDQADKVVLMVDKAVLEVDEVALEEDQADKVVLMVDKAVLEVDKAVSEADKVALEVEAITKVESRQVPAGSKAKGQEIPAHLGVDRSSMADLEVLETVKVDLVASTNICRRLPRVILNDTTHREPNTVSCSVACAGPRNTGPNKIRSGFGSEARSLLRRSRNETSKECSRRGSARELSIHKVLVEAKVALEEDQADKVVSEVDKAALEADKVVLEVEGQ
ncbi:hypothetical protein PR048_028093 [Dryococelus australis]|uniref:Uncharacterized protein n=1 Tax=Dryococelus australis TaxID=614101 RepID=A0ABQ9GIB1_9NEOP|nr:hypothetical protein PR048_028093 [Dryococelus australis]